MKGLFTTLILAFLISVSCAADCAGYTDEFDVRALDAKLRPVEGAYIQVTYDRGSSFGQQYFTTEPLRTDGEGIVHMAVYNQGTETRPIDCTIWVNATIGDGYAERTIEANSHPLTVDLNLDVYPIDIRVNDMAGNPIEGAVVTINGESKETGSNGRVKFHAAPGTVDYFVSYEKGTEGGTIPVTDDVDYEVVLYRYTVTINAVDDRGNPVDAVITILNETMAMADGVYQSDEIYGNTLEAELEYAGIEKSIVMDLAKETERTVVFDVNPPTIDSTSTSMVGSRPRLTIKLADEGEYASGVDSSAVKVTYRILPSPDAQWVDATVFVSGVNTYTIDFPEIGENKLIDFKIEARDMEGNKVVQSGKFVTEKEEENGETPPEVEETDQDFPLIYIIIGAILIIVVVYIVRYLLKRKGNEV